MKLFVVTRAMAGWFEIWGNYNSYFNQVTRETNRICYNLPSFCTNLCTNQPHCCSSHFKNCSCKRSSTNVCSISSSVWRSMIVPINSIKLNSVSTLSFNLVWLLYCVNYCFVLHEFSRLHCYKILFASSTIKLSRKNSQGLRFKSIELELQLLK